MSKHETVEEALNIHAFKIATVLLNSLETELEKCKHPRFINGDGSSKRNEEPDDCVTWDEIQKQLDIMKNLVRY